MTTLLVYRSKFLGPVNIHVRTCLQSTAEASKNLIMASKLLVGRHSRQGKQY